MAALAADPAARLVAGGTNLLDLMKYDVEQPGRLIDIGGIDGLDRIEMTASGGLRIGALVSNTSIAYHPAVVELAPLLSDAILAGATPQLRNAATAGGNLNQRTRCYYFYDVQTPCNKREPGQGCGAIGGANRIHAILGASPHCIATHPSDMCVALAALEATVCITGPQGERRLPFTSYHRLPGEEPWRDTDLAPGELVTAIDLPPERFVRHHTYLKLRDRLSYAFAIVSVAVGMRIEDGRIAALRVALGGVAHKPWRSPGAEALAQGKPPSPQVFEAVAGAILHGAVGQGDNDFKIPLARKALLRALAQAAAGTPQSQTDKRIA